MNTELPEDLRSHFYALEQQAASLMRSGHYELAEKIFYAMLETVMKRQQKGRIHKGSYFYNIGFSQVLQDRLIDALHNILLAYVEDCLNTQINQENSADTLPAARVLRKGFLITDQNLKVIKDIVRGKKQNGEIIFDPEEVFKDFLHDLSVDENNLYALCARRPQLDQVKDTLIVSLTPEAKHALDEIVSKMGDKVLRRAIDIARRRQARVVAEDDVMEAIRQLEEEQK